jgi:hypothetical protein
MEYLDGEFTANHTYYSIRPIDHISLLLLLLLLFLLPLFTLIFSFCGFWETLVIIGLDLLWVVIFSRNNLTF